MTALMLACDNNTHESVAVLVMESTQKAGALDVQVNVVWSECWEGCGQVCGGRDGKGGRGGGGGGGICTGH
jgi:hypothetical protein